MGNLVEEKEIFNYYKVIDLTLLLVTMSISLI